MVMIVAFLGCTQQSKDKISTESDSTMTSTQVLVEEETEAPPDFSTPLSQLASIITGEGIPISSEYIPLLELLVADGNLTGEFRSSISAQNIDNSKYLLVLYESLGCTTINCERLHTVLLFDPASVISRLQVSIHYQKDLRCAFLHNAFVLLEATVKNYQESEEGAMVETNEPETYLREYAVVIDNQVLLLSKLDKNKLAWCHNYLLARYGYQFPEPELREYFGQFAWYQPTHSQVENMLTPDDQNLLAQIRNLESQY